MDLPDKKVSTTWICLNTKNKLRFSPRAIANTFKENFASLASDLVKKLPDPTGKFEILSVLQNYKGINFREKKLKFKKVSSVSILKILKEFKASKATELDNLAGRFLKDCSNTLCTPIAKICKLSNKLAIFSNKCKVTKIKPLYKKGLKTSPKKFRPVSLLPPISKIHDQTMNFLSDNKFQSGLNTNIKIFTQQTLVYHTSMTKSQKVSILIS